MCRRCLRRTSSKRATANPTPIHNSQTAACSATRLTDCGACIARANSHPHGTTKWAVTAQIPTKASTASQRDRIVRPTVGVDIRLCAQQWR